MLSSHGSERRLNGLRKVHDHLLHHAPKSAVHLIAGTTEIVRLRAHERIHARRERHVSLRQKYLREHKAGGFDLVVHCSVRRDPRKIRSIQQHLRHEIVRLGRNNSCVVMRTRSAKRRPVRIEQAWADVPREKTARRPRRERVERERSNTSRVQPGKRDRPEQSCNSTHDRSDSGSPRSRGRAESSARSCPRSDISKRRSPVRVRSIDRVRDVHDRARRVSDVAEEELVIARRERRGVHDQRNPRSLDAAAAATIHQTGLVFEAFTFGLVAEAMRRF